MRTVRSAIGMIVPDAYDAAEWRLSVLALKDGGGYVLPRWTAKNIQHHARCTCEPRT